MDAPNQSYYCGPDVKRNDHSVFLIQALLYKLIMCQTGSPSINVFFWATVCDWWHDGGDVSLPLFLYWVVPAYLILYKVMFYFLSYV